MFLFIILYTCKNVDKDEKGRRNEIVPLNKDWEKAIPHQDVPPGLLSLTAESCGTCHQEIFQDWKQSTHAAAFRDLQFQVEWAKDDIYACLNCHTPLQNQQAYIVKGLINGDHKTPVMEANPNFDKELQQEGVTCASCHVREGAVIGTSENQRAPHKMVKDRQFLSEKLCISCHNLVDELNPVLVCSFETGDEWRNNGFLEKGRNCITCHMPETKRVVASGMGKRKSHFHFFPGSGIPKFYGQETKGLNGLEIAMDSLPDRYTQGETMEYLLTVKNRSAGHNIPTGDPERFILIAFKVLDSSGTIIREKRWRIGEEWQWHPVAKKLSDNNLKPGEERKFEFAYVFRDKGEFTIVVEVTKHRMTEDNARYNGILDKYPLSVGVVAKRYKIRVI